MKKKNYDSRQSKDSQGSVHKSVKVPMVKIKQSAYGISTPEGKIFPESCIEKKLKRVGNPGGVKNRDLVDNIIDEQDSGVSKLRK